MIVLGSVVHIEHHRHLRVETVETQRREVRLRVEDQPVCAIGHRLMDEKERFHAAVRVGPGMAQLGPTLVSVLHFQTNRHTAGWGAPRRVEDVGRNRAHVGSSLPIDYGVVSNFFSRNSVILLCSAAAMGSSSAASCSIRSRNAANISPEDLPVAQMMKI